MRSSAEEISDASLRASILFRIAKAQAADGENAGAYASFSHALSAAIVAGGESPDGQSNMKFSLGDTAHQLRSLFLADAAAVWAILDEPGQARELFQEAVSLAERIDAIHLRTGSLVDIALAQVEAGALQQARETVSRADLAGTWYAIDPGAFAKAQANAGDVPGALATAGEVPDTGVRARIHAVIVAAQAADGDVAGAVVIAERIEHPFHLLVAMHHIGVAHAKAGNVEEAWAAAGRIEKIWRSDTEGLVGSRDMEIFRADTIAAIVDAHMATGALNLAAAAAKVTGDDFAFIEAHVKIAKAQALAGDLDSAVAAAKLVCSGFDYADRCVEALAGLGVAHAGKGQEADARQLLSMAWDKAASIIHDPDRSQAFGELYAAWRQVGDAAAAAQALAGAQVSAEAINNSAERAGVLAGISAMAVRAGDTGGAAQAFAAALSAVDEIRDPEERVWAAVNTGVVLRGAGGRALAEKAFSRSVISALAIDDASLRSGILAGIEIALDGGQRPEM